MRENWRQFTLLVIINAFVGGMAGLERNILPQIAEVEFHLSAKTAILSFIMAFGVVKAIANYLTGTLANKWGRKNLLITGWLFGIPVPFILMQADNWNWIITANVLLGINQGLTWSSTVMMKIDLVGEKQRGLAMGINEFAGYLALSIVAFSTGWIASEYGLRPYPFYVGIGLVLAGLFCSWIFVKDTRHHVASETTLSDVPRLKKIFWETTWRNRNLGSVTQAGLVNNLNDALTWGLLPLLLVSKNFNLGQIGIITAVYPAVWGVGQLFTGRMADYFCKKDLLFWGMLLQAFALMLLPFGSGLIQFIVISAVIGWGTAMVYPTFLATVAEHTHPSDRAKCIGIFRLWRDLGYAIGAVIAGLVADAFGLDASVVVVGLITLFSAIIIGYRMKCASGKAVTLKDWINRTFSRSRPGRYNDAGESAW